MRRLKSDMLGLLPDKIVQDYPCQLSEIQRRLYAAIVERCAYATGNVGPRKEDEYDSSSLSPIRTLTALRKLVDHPLLVFDIVRQIGASIFFDDIDDPKNKVIFK